MTAVESKTEERLTELEANHEYKVKLYTLLYGQREITGLSNSKHNKVFKPGACSVSQCGIHTQ